MRKIAILLVLTMLTSSFTFHVYASDNTSEVSQEYQQALSLLTDLGVRNLSVPDKTVSYSAFDGAIRTALGQNTSNYDITDITGIKYSTASANRVMTYMDAVKTLVILLGYKVKAEANGGHLSAYLSIARQIGLLKGTVVDANSVLTTQTAAILLYNALNTEVLQPISTGTKNEYGTEKGYTLLYQYRRYVKETGIVEANPFSSLYTDEGMPGNYVQIDGARYVDKEQKAVDYLGYRIDFYYYDGDDGEHERYEIISVYLNPKYNNEIVIGDNYESSNGRTIYYTSDNGKDILHEEIPAEAAILCNGVALYSYNNDTFDLKDSKAILIDNNGDDKIDVVSIKRGVNFFVNNVNLEFGIIYDALGGNILDINDKVHKRVRIFNEAGERINYVAIEKNTVMTVYESENLVLVDCYLSRTTVTGVIEGKSTDNAQEYITINGQDYVLSEEARQHQDERYVLGTSGVFYMNLEGKIVYFDTSVDTMIYGFLIDSQVKRGLGNVVETKILSQDGKIYYYDTKDKVKIDGSTIKTAEEIVSLLSPRQIIRYAIDENNCIVEVDTIVRGENESPDSLTSFGPPTSSRYATSYGFGGKFFLNAAPIIFVGSSDLTVKDDEEFGVVPLSYLTNTAATTASYSASGYCSSQYGFEAEAMVIHEKMSKFGYSITNTTSSFMCVASIKKVINDQGEVVYEIAGFSSNTKATYKCANPSIGEGMDIGIGDIVAYALTGKGEIGYLEMVYDYSEDKFKLPDYASSEYRNRCFLDMGYAIWNNGEYVLAYRHDMPDSMEEALDRNELTYIRITNLNVCVVDSNYGENDERHVRGGSVLDSKPYITHFKGCSKIFFRGYDSSPRFLVIYN